ncbi:MAG: SpoIIE family protein phosphatase [bacterium]|nr:SpoIIE family protein phosphatase [bacterium]
MGPSHLELRAATGPTAVSLSLQPPGPATIGRGSANVLQLADPAVSRDHAQLSFRPKAGSEDAREGDWLVSDLGSTHGTWLNGVRLKPNRQYHVRPRDLIVIGPWTMMVVDRNVAAPAEATLATVVDAAAIGTVVGRYEPLQRGETPAGGLEVLHRCSERVHAAQSEQAIAEAVLDAARAGTRFLRAAFLRPLTDGGAIEVVASRTSDTDEAAPAEISQALLREASTGSMASLRRGPRDSQSADQKTAVGQTVALCIPIMIESTLTGFLYLDRPLNTPRAQVEADDPDGVLVGLARLAGLGLARLMRIDIERRHERMEAEFHAAAEATHWLLPHRKGRCGPFGYVGETRQGQYVGGDFFDIISLSDDRLGLVVGDVCGQGIPVSILVSASLGFMHAVMEERADPAAAVASINRLYTTRVAHSRMLKLWVGVFDAGHKELTFVSAGHGCAMILSLDGSSKLLPAGTGSAVGIKDEAEFRAQTVPLEPGFRALVLTDGFVQQKALDPGNDCSDDNAADEPHQRPQAYGIGRVQACLMRTPLGGDELETLFTDLQKHAGTSVFDDDATAVLVHL